MADLPLKPIEEEPADEDRVRRIMTRTRREIAARDLLTFSATRAWAGVVGIGSALLAWALFLTGGHKKSYPHPNDDGEDET